MVAVGGLRHLELVLAQQHREDRLDLHLRESGPDATVPARAERNPGPPVDDVGLLGFVVPVRVEGIRVGEVLGNPVGDRRGRRHVVAVMDREARDLELAFGDPHQNDQRRVQPQGLLDHVVQLRNLAQRMETHLLAVGVQFLELGEHLGVGLGVADQLDQRPRRRCRSWCGARRTSAR